MEREKAKDLLIYSATLAALCIIAKCIGKILFLALLPFAAAWIISLLIKPLSVFLSKKLKLKKSFLAAVLVTVIISLLVLGVGYLAAKLVREAAELCEMLINELEYPEGPLKKIFDTVNSFKEKLPFSDMKDSGASLAVYEGIRSIAESSLKSISSGFGEGITSLVTKMPSIIFAFITTVIALFYFTAGTVTLSSRKNKDERPEWLEKLTVLRSRVTEALSKYAKSYLIILLITFAELLLGFVILRVEYALLIALITAIVDFLPVVGTGIIIVPWSAFCILTGDIKRGVGLIILWMIMYLVRQIIEPKIIGDVMGIHPLLSLFAVYLGYVSLGVLGMILFPIILCIAKSTFSTSAAGKS